MRLDHQTRRAAMLQAFRAYRIAQPDSPLRCAYLFADSMIKPLPEDPIDINVRHALREYQSRQAGKAPQPLLARAIWKHCYALERAGDLL